MAQHDYVIDNASGATVRADINSALSAIQTLNSGTSAPSSTAAGMLWLDTTGGAPYALKVRDAGNNHWLTLASVTDPGSDGNIETSATIKGTIDSSADLSNANFPTPTHAELYGTNTTGSITSGTNALTVASSAGISNGDFVVAIGIDPGTTVSSGAGTTSLVLSANANVTLSSERVTFYKANKILTTGLTGPMLCKAWCNYDSANTNILSAYNIRSVTKIGTGDLRFTFETDFPDEDYIIVGSCFGYDGSRSLPRILAYQATAASTYNNAQLVGSAHVRVYQGMSASDIADVERVMIIFLR